MVEGPLFGIAVWGDNVTTAEVDGCLVGDSLGFMVWDASAAYEWEPAVSHLAGDGTYGDGPYAHVKLSGEITKANELPLRIWANRLSPSYPNPSGPGTAIQYELSAAGNVTLTILNVGGQRVRRLVDRVESAGQHMVIWDGLDDAGGRAPSGIYFYRIETAHFESVRRMVVLK
jgi:hypothetical protein